MSCDYDTFNSSKNNDYDTFNSSRNNPSMSSNSSAFMYCENPSKNNTYTSDKYNTPIENTTTFTPYNSNSFKNIQNIQEFNSVKLRKDWLNKIKTNYGLFENTQRKKIIINKLTSPVNDLFAYIRKATNIDLLQPPLFIIGDEK